MVYAEPSSGEAAFRGRDDGAGPARTTKRARVRFYPRYRPLSGPCWTSQRCQEETCIPTGNVPRASFEMPVCNLLHSATAASGSRECSCEKVREEPQRDFK